MFPHPMVRQLRFARSEFMRCLDGVSDEDAVRRVAPMNCISWILGHLAEQEQRFYLELPGRGPLVAGLSARVGYGSPATTPPLEEMMAAWQAITQATDRYLAQLGAEDLQVFFVFQGEEVDENLGTLMRRNIYHYWFHTGEAHAVRQMLGHTHLPQFVGEMSAAAYLPWES
jgi:uncharacterized damage-inducible protein DinB